MTRQEIRKFLDWVYRSGSLTKARIPAEPRTRLGNTCVPLLRGHGNRISSSHHRVSLSPGRRNVAGRHYLTKAEIDALYFATHKMERPRGWDRPMPIGRYWRSAIVVFFNYGLDTGTVWKSAPFHEPILWRHVSWSRQSPDRQVKELSPWGWLFYRRVKTGKAFYRPMNRVVHAHIKSIMPESPVPDDTVFLGGGSRPNARFAQLCELAGIRLKADIETGEDKPSGTQRPP